METLFFYKVVCLLKDDVNLENKFDAITYLSTPSFIKLDSEKWQNVPLELQTCLHMGVEKFIQ